MTRFAGTFVRLLFFMLMSFFILTGCSINSLTQENGGGNSGGSSAETVLSVDSILYSGTNAVATYDILGVGPGTESFSKYDLAGTNYRFNNLVGGLWAVLVYARDTNGKIVASGFVQTNVASGKTTSVSVSLTDASGKGTLVIIVSWPYVPNDSLAVSLFSNSTEFPLTMALGDDGQSASFIDTHVAGGSYDLKLVLKCDTTNLWSVFPSFSVIPGEITTIRYQLTTNDIGIQFSRNFVIYGETVPYQNKFLFDRDGHLNVWNNLSIFDDVDCYEGNVSWGLATTAVAWWGMGITEEVPGPKDLSMYTQGSLHFAMKTTSQATFKVGFKNSTTEYWLTLYPYDERYGLARDGQWHDVCIPFSLFGNPVMSSVNQVFMLSDSTPSALFSANLDAIYYAWEPANLGATNMTTNNFKLLTNIVVNTFVNQSSIYNSGWPYYTGYYPEYAVDNNEGGLPAMTYSDTNAWWETDLGCIRYVHSIKVLDGGSGSTALSNFYIFISQTPFNSSALSITLNQAGVSKYFFTNALALTNKYPFGVQGRYVRIQRTDVLPLYLQEVEIFDYYVNVIHEPLPALTNAALNTSPNQSSIGNYPEYAVDNNVSTVASTGADTNAWWETDLGSVKDIDSIKLWLYGTPLKNFYVFVSSNPFDSSDLNMTKNQSGVTKIFITNDAGVTKVVAVGTQGRYVRIQRTDVAVLEMNEVRIMVPSSEMTSPAVLSNAALISYPNQSSLYNSGWPYYTCYYPGYAVDNNITGTPATTQSDTNAWWETDLESVKDIDNVQLRLYGTPLRNFYVFVSSNPFDSSDLNMTKNQSGVTKIFITNDAGVTKTIAVGVQGRYVRIQRTDVGSLYLNEVRVMIPPSEMTGPAALSNAALGTVPNQSSLYNSGWPYYVLYEPTLAVDNNTVGDGATTLSDTNAWWETDLGGVKDINSVQLYLYGTPLRNFYVFVSSNPFDSSDLNMTKNQSGVTKIFITNDAGIQKIVSVGVQGRYVRIQRTDVGSLYLSEVRVMVPSSEITSPTTLSNYALGTVPTQSSIYNTGWPYYQDYGPAYAVDNNNAGTPATTLSDTNAWWQTDLGSSKNIDSVRMYLYGTPLKNFYVFVSPNPFASSDLNTTLTQSGVAKVFITNDAGVLKTIAVGTSGRYVRIQRTDVSSLQLNEVMILAP